MDFDPQPFELLNSLGRWALALLAVSLIGLFVGLVVALATLGKDGPKFVFSQLGRIFSEWANLSPGRLWAVTTLTIKESLRRKALYIFGVFALLFMFASWFFGEQDYSTATPFVVFVLKTVRWLSIPLAVILACWGLPADIKARSLHTVVTKPVRRTEVVFGRILGYSAVTGAVVLIMGVIGYVWITRSVPDALQSQLIGRVPVHADDLRFLDRAGAEQRAGINVGNIYEFRSYVEGASRARAVFHFYDFADKASYYIDQNKPVPLEYGFEVFRSYKGDVGEEVLAGTATDVEGTRAQFGILVADDTLADGVRTFRFPQFPFELKEYSASVTDRIQELPMELENSEDGEVKTFNVLEEMLVDLDGDEQADDLAIEVRMLDSQQYLGVARPDLFIRLPDRPFISGYAKAILAILMTCVLVIILGTTASTFVKGPVATLLTLGFVGVGFLAQDFAEDYLDNFSTTGEALGGGPLESAYRLVLQKSQTVPLPESTGLAVVQTIDSGILRVMDAVFLVLPDMRTFNLDKYVAEGFDPPFWDAFLPTCLMVLAFLLPCLVIGYLSLQLRELESK